MAQPLAARASRGPTGTTALVGTGSNANYERISKYLGRVAPDEMPISRRDGSRLRLGRDGRPRPPSCRGEPRDGDKLRQCRIYPVGRLRCEPVASRGFSCVPWPGVH